MHSTNVNNKARAVPTNCFLPSQKVFESGKACEEILKDLSKEDQLKVLKLLAHGLDRELSKPGATRVASVIGSMSQKVVPKERLNKTSKASFKKINAAYVEAAQKDQDFALVLQERDALKASLNDLKGQEYETAKMAVSEKSLWLRNHVSHVIDARTVRPSAETSTVTVENKKGSEESI